MPAGLYSPAGAGRAITVDPTGREDKKPAFSHHGPAVVLFASRGAAGSASAAGDTGRVAAPGTSTAFPHAAGATAPRLAGHRRATPAQVAKALVERAPTGKAGGRGPGSPNRLPRTPAPWCGVPRPRAPTADGVGRETGDGVGAGPSRAGSALHGEAGLVCRHTRE
ncbi:S8 family serine peptidase [Streptomyces sp. NPDC007000]|uniref:S8 family serine peptidase n=1 Tax=unclassified Streptomyces TaxID=2593676 RepID=UPI0034118549